MKPSYYERVMSNDKKFNVLLAARRSGKSTLAFDLMLEYVFANPMARVLYITPYPGSTRFIRESILHKYKDRITMYNDTAMSFNNGSVIYLRDNMNLAGLYADYVVVDDAGFIKDTLGYLYSIMVQAKRVFVTGSWGWTDSILARMAGRPPADSYMEEYTWKDALGDSILAPQMIEEMRKALSTEQFAQEFGEWNKLGPWREGATNKDFEYLLRKD